MGMGPADPPTEEPTRPELKTEPRRQKELHDEGVITIVGDIPLHTPVPEQVRQLWPEGVPEPDNEEIPAPPPEVTISHRRETEIRRPEKGWWVESRAVIDSRLAAHASEHADIGVTISVGPSSGSLHIESEIGVHAPAKEVREIRMERASGETAKAKYESRREAAHQRSQEAGQADEKADEAIEIGGLGFSAAMMAIARVDKRICQAATTSFHRYTLLSDELAIKKGEVEQLTAQLAEERVENKAWRARLEAKEAEWEKKLKEMSTAVERFSATKVVDWTEQSRYGIRGEGMQGLFGQGEAAETSQQEKLKKVFLDPVEAEARREANKGSFEFRAPTELASRQEAPISAKAPIEVPTQEPQPAPVEEEVAEESLTILLEVQEGTLTGAVAPPQSEAQGRESSRLDELVAAMEVDMPSERPQRIETLEHVPEIRELRAQLGS
ncbi:hypothetical protein CBR_g22999 [Chara braunii]|uniref:Uncharacterized protein n=1 Tax=Chara braunii TaxID=69332 RepID=A0A388L3K2_CHABU|nr:hypothetical protein CBR_g22999 [Chara braunii]|eukprot:GBG76783.1 hypothetical protein CBR_g22999 [Chara braunii]